MSIKEIVVNGKTIKYRLFIRGADATLEKVAASPRGFRYSLEVDGKKYTGDGARGDFSAWMPTGVERGYKFILPSTEFSVDDLYDNVSYIKGLNSPIFPEIYFIGKTDEFLVVEMRRMHNKKGSKLSAQDHKWLGKDAVAAEALLENNLSALDEAVNELTKHHLFPEDEWYKGSNLIGGKIIDFHWFHKKPKRYLFPAVVSKKESDSIYKKALAKYKARGDNKWKGKIYQGHNFDNEYVMAGYSSDGAMFDSYRKLPFCYMGKVKGKKVFDFGCNEGFFSLESYMHGAAQVTGIDLCSEDVALAKNIKDMVGADDRLFFKEGDAVKEFMKSKDKFEVVVMNSVLHQIYKNMVGADALLGNIASKTRYFVYETPANHPLMNIPLEDIHKKLCEFFKIVRLTYVYNAYSSGYRANFVCYTFKD